MDLERYSTRWLFRILDYEHWNLLYDGEPIAQVVINHADRSVSGRSYADPRSEFDVTGFGAYRTWRSLLTKLEAPL